MKFTQRQLAIILIAGLVVVGGLGVFYFGLRGSSSQSAKLTLTAWGTDPKTVFDALSTAYKTYAPNTTIDYTQIDPASYQSILLKAFAAGTGPDIFELKNHDLGKWISETAALPTSFSSQFNLAMLQQNFPDVVSQDFVTGGNIYAMPLDLDTMVMYYNKDLFNTAGIVYPPKTWNDFEADIPKLRILNSQGQITQAAAAIGGSQTSIADAPDIVFLLMLQNGTTMVSNGGTTAAFDNTDGENNNPGLTAFNFYLQFANPSSPYYTWNDGMGNALQSFASGETAILFDYGSAMSTFKQKAPFLHYGIAPMPQPASATIAVNYPSYEGLAVSRAGQIMPAWSFVLYVTSNPAAENVYGTNMGEMPANRATIATAMSDATYGVFASQALTARSWYEADSTQIDTIMNTAIQNVLGGTMDSSNALGVAATAITGVMQNAGNQ